MKCPACNHPMVATHRNRLTYAEAWRRTRRCNRCRRRFTTIQPDGQPERIHEAGKRYRRPAARPRRDWLTLMHQHVAQVTAQTTASRPDFVA